MDPDPPSTSEPNSSGRAGASGKADSGHHIRPWLWPNLLSLDAPIVAVAWLWLLASVVSISLPEPLWCYGIVAASVWVVYVSDRLLDGMAAMDEQSLTPRHRFYRRFPIPFILLALGAAVFAIYGALFHVPRDVFRAGLAVGFVSLFYLMQCVSARLKSSALNLIVVFSAAAIISVVVLQIPFVPQHQWIQLCLVALTVVTALRLAIEPGGSLFHALPTEIFCGVTFAVGISLPVLVWGTSGWGGTMMVQVLLMGALFSLNCIGIAFYEKRHDEANDPVAITKLWPRIQKTYPYLITGTVALAAGIGFLQIDSGTHYFPFLVAFGAVLLGLLHVSSNRLGTAALRVLADFALLIPPAVFYLIRPWIAG